MNFINIILNAYESYYLPANKNGRGFLVLSNDLLNKLIKIDSLIDLDIEKETQRLKEQINDTKEYISILDKKLLNESFVRNAPAALVRAEQEKKQQAIEKLKKLEEKFEKLS